MSIRLAMLAVLIALALGITLALMQRQPATPAGGSSTAELAQFDAGRVMTMLVQRNGQPDVTVRRSSAGAWELAMPGAAPWVVVPENPINLLRGLRTLTGQKPGVDGLGADGVPPDAVRLTLTSDHGEVTRFAFDPAPVGGRIRAWANDRGPYLVGDEILIALTDPGPIGWRIPRVFPGFNEFTASRLALSTDERPALELTRMVGRWHMDAPVRATADQRAVGELLRALASLPVSRFMATTDALERRAESAPAWKIRVASGADASSTAELSIWGALEPSGSILLAAVATGDQPRTFLAMPASALTSLVVAPEAYLAPSPSDQSVNDIAAIAVHAPDGERVVRLARDLSRWTVAIGDEAPRLDVDGVAEQLLALLTRQPAQTELFPQGAIDAAPSAAAALAQPQPEGFVPVAAIELLRLDGGVLEVIRLGVAPHAVPSASPSPGAPPEADPSDRVLTALRGQTRWNYLDVRDLPKAVRLLTPGPGLPGLD
jgi:hypothetical protein